MADYRCGTSAPARAASPAGRLSRRLAAACAPRQAFCRKALANAALAPQNPFHRFTPIHTDPTRLTHHRHTMQLTPLIAVHMTAAITARLIV